MPKLFSIKQEFSEKIFSNEKLVEFRRQNVNIRKNEICLVYTSRPIKEITGYFVVKEKIRLPINKLWAKTKKYAGITKKQFYDYFAGCKEGTAILVEKVKKFIRAVGLEEIRDGMKNFHPPQSYYTINNNLQILLSEYLPQKSLRNFWQFPSCEFRVDF